MKWGKVNGIEVEGVEEEALMAKAPPALANSNRLSEDVELLESS